MERAIDELQGNVERIAACEVLRWPDCGRPRNIFARPTPSEAAKPPQTYSFEALGPKLSQVTCWPTTQTHLCFGLSLLKGSSRLMAERSLEGLSYELLDELQARLKVEVSERFSGALLAGVWT